MTGRNFLSGPPGDLAATIAATTPGADDDRAAMGISAEHEACDCHTPPPGLRDAFNAAMDELDGPMTAPRTDYTWQPPSGAAERALDGEPDGVIAVDEEGVAYQRIDSGWYMSGAPSRYTSRYLARMGARVVWRAEAATT